jgi:hypothetical protein
VAPRHWTAVAFGGGLVTAAMLIGTSAPVLAASAAADGLEPSAAQALGVLEFAFFIGAGIGGASLLGATGILAIRTAVLPTWLGWASLVIALLMVTIIGPIGFHRDRSRPPAVGAGRQHPALEEEQHRFSSE